MLQSGASVDAATSTLDRLAEAVRCLSARSSHARIAEAAAVIVELPGLAGLTVEQGADRIAVGNTDSPGEELPVGPGSPVSGRVLAHPEDGEMPAATRSALEVFVRTLCGVLEQEHALAALRERDEQARAVVAISLDPIVSMDAGGLIRAFNPAAERTFGHRADDVLGLPLADVLVPPRMRGAHVAGVPRYLATGTSDMLGRRLEQPAMCADGREITVELAVVPTVSDGEPVFIGFLRDVTERASMQRRLEETSSRLGTLIGSMHAAVLVEEENRRIVVVNRAFTDMFEVPSPPEALLGADCSHAAEQSAGLFEAPDEFVAGVDRVLGERVPVIGEELHLRDGRCLERDYVPVFRDEEYLGHLWAYRDVTTRKRVERRLVEQNETLADIAQMKDRFLAAVSHELRTPLTSVLTFAEILGDPESGELSGRQRQYLDVVQRNGTQLLRLVEDILAFMRAGSDELSVEVDWLDVAGLLRDVVLEHRARAVERQVLLSLEVPQELRVQADADRLRQVLDNLVGNAVKFTPAGGHASVSAAGQGDVWRITVSDTGIGIPESEQGRLFTGFFRASNARSGSTPGTGLGLVISRAIVELHGGSITVASAEGEGTTVTVELPVRAAAGPDPSGWVTT